MEDFRNDVHSFNNLPARPVNLEPLDTRALGDNPATASKLPTLPRHTLVIKAKQDGEPVCLGLHGHRRQVTQVPPALPA